MEAIEKKELDVVMCYGLNNITINEELLIKFYKYVRSQGMCKELEEIYNEGEQSGVQKGIQKGELKKARETVFALLEMGMPVEQITKAVKIPLTTVQSWIAETKF